MSLSSLLQVLKLIGASLAILFAAPLVGYAYTAIVQARSYAHLDGPPSKNFVLGNLQDEMNDHDSSLLTQWLNKYGRIYKVTRHFGKPEIVLNDLKAIAHVLKNDYDYQKPDELQFIATEWKGILIAEGDEHRKQRRVMNPAFGPAQIRELTNIFIDKSIELRDAWNQIIQKETGVGHIDGLGWLTRMTLDVIGHAGFGYQFHAMQDLDKPNELNTAFSHIFETGTNQLPPIVLAKLFWSFLRPLPDGDAKFRQAHATMSTIGKKLLAERKNGSDDRDGKDLLSLLVKANTSSELSERQRLSDSTVLAQVPTFLVAGHETTSTATTFALHNLTGNLDVQSKLRAELLAVLTDTPAMEQLNSLPYLDAVVRETLRLSPPVVYTTRIAFKDDVIPLDEPFTDKNGVVHHELRIKRGTEVQIPIVAMNRDVALWGDDAFEFKPERWEKLPEAITAVPGIWGNLMTFLGGAHACIGWRFSVIEIKALLFTLVRAFEFELAVPRDMVLIRQGLLVQRPAVKGSEETNDLPLLIRPVLVA
ncbi:hypothetical protein VNI00_004768 [Paramarasmius palmivorus]|uniref:Cytochrome P450 n=1 Tax=Paramarasmius palmivorus TaxID=297713 RepID=A0AAW0DHF2_9AGAR